MTIEFRYLNNKFIKQWPNWSGLRPAVNDWVLLHFGDNNEEIWECFVHRCIIDGTKPDKLVCIIEKIN